MSNTMIEANESLFSSILKEVSIHGSIHEQHCILLGNEKDFFEDINITKIGEKPIIIPILYNKSAILLNKENDYYLVMNNTTVDIYNKEDNDFIEICEDYTASIFLLLGANKLIKFDSNRSLDIYDELLYSEENTEHKWFDYFGNGTRKHSFDSIKPYFEDFKVFKIINNDFFLNPSNSDINIYKLLSFLLINKNNMRQLPFEEETLLQFSDISIERNFFIPYEFIMESLIAIKWKHVFKDLYRCVENLYAFPKAKKLIEKMNCSESIKIEQIVEDLESQLGWRPPEQQALQELLKFSTTEVLDEFLKVFLKDELKKELEKLQNEKKSYIDEEEVERLSEKIHRKKADYIGVKLYNLRNSLVHFRKALNNQDTEFNDEQWNILIKSMLMFIIEIYNEMYEHE